jgi:hypothetical protein
VPRSSVSIQLRPGQHSEHPERKRKLAQRLWTLKRVPAMAAPSRLPDCCAGPVKLQLLNPRKLHDFFSRFAAAEPRSCTGWRSSGRHWSVPGRTSVAPHALASWGSRRGPAASAAATPFLLKPACNLSSSASATAQQVWLQRDPLEISRSTPSRSHAQPPQDLTLNPLKISRSTPSRSHAYGKVCQWPGRSPRWWP